MKMILLTALAAVGCLVGCSKTEPTSTTSDAAPAAPAVSTSTNGLIATASGLRYEVLKHGSGTVTPKVTDTVKVDYTGVLMDGTVFDSSVQRGEPASFPVNAVIPGWTEGLQLMKVGDKFRFVIPANLAYGDQSPTPKIPPGSTLVFEVELLGIQ